MIMQRVSANTLTLPIVPRRRAPTGDYEFVHEGDYEMDSVAGRIAWFCDEFDVERPTLKLDPECPDDEEAVLMTDDLMAWFKAAGLSFDFAFVGGIKACVASYRKELLQTREIVEITSQMEPPVKAAFTSMMKAVVEHSIPMEEAYAVFDEVVKDCRATA